MDNLIVRLRNPAWQVGPESRLQPEVTQRDMAAAAEEIERISALWIAETRENERLRAENERLRALLTDAPVLVINERYAAVIGEDVCLAYVRAIREWHPKVQAVLTGKSAGEK